MVIELAGAQYGFYHGTQVCLTEAAITQQYSLLQKEKIQYFSFGLLDKSDKLRWREIKKEVESQKYAKQWVDWDWFTIISAGKSNKGLEHCFPKKACRAVLVLTKELTERAKAIIWIPTGATSDEKEFYGCLEEPLKRVLYGTKYEKHSDYEVLAKELSLPPQPEDTLTV